MLRLMRDLQTVLVSSLGSDPVVSLCVSLSHVFASPTSQTCFHQRISAYRAWQNAESTLVKKKEAEANYTARNRVEKLDQAAREVTEAEEVVSLAHDNFDKISARLKKELKRFDIVRVRQPDQKQRDGSTGGGKDFQLSGPLPGFPFRHLPCFDVKNHLPSPYPHSLTHSFSPLLPTGPRLYALHGGVRRVDDDATASDCQGVGGVSA